VFHENRMAKIGGLHHRRSLSDLSLALGLCDCAMGDEDVADMMAELKLEEDELWADYRDVSCDDVSGDDGDGTERNTAGGEGVHESEFGYDAGGAGHYGASDVW
jgi:hypothetical protein